MHAYDPCKTNSRVLSDNTREFVLQGSYACISQNGRDSFLGAYDKIQPTPYFRVPSRSFGIRNLAYFKVGFREEKASEIRDCNLWKGQSGDLAILRNGIQNKDLGSPVTKMYQGNQLVIFVNVRNS